MSRPKPNLTPAQRKAYDARMKQLRQQQQRRRRVTPKVGILGGRITAEQRKKLQKDARIQRRKTIRTLREKPNKTAQEKQYLAAVKKMRQQKRRQRMINKQRRDAQNRVTKPKAPPRPTRLTGPTRSYVKVRARGRG